MVQILTDRMMAWIDKPENMTGRVDPILDYEIGVNRSIGAILGSHAKTKEVQDTHHKRTRN